MIPCGKCLGCRLEYSRQWAVRCEHELRLHKESCFITLTYDKKYLPYETSLNGDVIFPTLKKKDLQDFFKRLRSAMDYSCEKLQIPKINIRYFACGEYGEREGRPHYHAIIFGWRPPDLRKYEKNYGKSEVYISDKLNKIWSKGEVIVGKSVNFETCAYVARYVVKKYKQEKGGFFDGNFYLRRQQSFIIASRRPAIGYTFFQKFNRDILKNDSIVGRGGVKMRPPRYYDKKIEEYFPERFEELKKERIKNSLEARFDGEINFRKHLKKMERIKEKGTEHLLKRS